MRRLLATALAALLLVACSGDGDDGSGEPRPGGGVTLVAGRVDNLALDPTEVRPVRTPFTVEALEQGRARARLTAVVVDGQEQTIEWQGGTPLPVESLDARPGRLDLDPVTVEASPEGLLVSLGGVTGALSPGRYRVVAPVAVGPEGVARPAESVDFEATEATRVEFEGTAFVRRPPDPVTLEGPGELVLVGDVELTTEEQDRRAGVFRFGPGPYRVDLVWVGRHLEMDATLDGEVETLEEPPQAEGG